MWIGAHLTEIHSLEAMIALIWVVPYKVGLLSFDITVLLLPCPWPQTSDVLGSGGILHIYLLISATSNSTRKAASILHLLKTILFWRYSLNFLHVLSSGLHYKTQTKIFINDYFLSVLLLIQCPMASNTVSTDTHRY